MERGLKAKRVFRGRVYEREITDLSRITSNEAATMIGITLRYLYHLVKLGRLAPIKKEGHLFFRYREIQNFLRERR